MIKCYAIYSVDLELNNVFITPDVEYIRKNQPSPHPTCIFQLNRRRSAT